MDAKSMRKTNNIDAASAGEAFSAVTAGEAFNGGAAVEAVGGAWVSEAYGRERVCEAGRKLLEYGLVARTWGDISCRVDEETFLLTPTDVEYRMMQPDDIVKLDIRTLGAVGPRKPSGEKALHAAVYEVFPDVGFVIHTHQVNAAAIGVAGFCSLRVTDEELDRLGGLRRARYALPRTKKQVKNVKEEMEAGAKVVIMRNHGAIVAGRDMQDALEKAALLEEICGRSLEFQAPQCSDDKKARDLFYTAKILKALRAYYPYVDYLGSDVAHAWADNRKVLRAQLDDMAQMIGSRIESVPNDVVEIIEALKSDDCVFVHGLGAFVKGESKDDLDELKVVAERAAVCALQTEAILQKNKFFKHLGGTDEKKKRKEFMKNLYLSRCDSSIMRFFFMQRYSRHAQ